MSKATATKTAPAQETSQPNKTKINGQESKINTQETKANEQTNPTRLISDPKEIAQIVMMQIDHVNVKKDELTIAVKALADTTKKLFSVYANQQAQIAQLAKQVEELQKAKGQ